MSIGLWYLPEPISGRHVVAGADALGVLGPLAGRDQLGQAVVADLDDALFHEQVRRLQVAVDDPVVVEVGDAVDQPLEPRADLGRRHPARVLLRTLARLGPATYSMMTNVSPASLLFRSWMASRFGHLRFMHWHDAAALDFEVAHDQLQRDLLAGVGGGVVDLAEARRGRWPA